PYPQCLELNHLEAASMLNELGAVIFRRGPSAVAAVALLLSWKLNVTGQSIPATTPNKATNSSAIHRDGKESEVRISSLIRKMTLEEKIGQLQQVNNVDVESPGNSNHRATQGS